MRIAAQNSTGGLQSKNVRILIAVMLATLASLPAQAGVIRFYATGVAGISGFVEFDASTVASGFGFVQVTAIVGLSLTVFGEVFDLGDVVPTAYTYINVFVTPPTIQNGSGLLADNGTRQLAFEPDGLLGTPMDGDASLALEEIIGGSSSIHRLSREVGTGNSSRTRHARAARHRPCGTRIRTSQAVN